MGNNNLIADTISLSGAIMTIIGSQLYINGIAVGGQTASYNLQIQSIKLPNQNPCLIDASGQNWRCYFDDTINQSGNFQFIVPRNYNSSPQAKVVFSMESGQNGIQNIVWEINVGAISPNLDAQDYKSKALGGVNSGNHILNSGYTGGYVRMQSINITGNDSMASGDLFMLRINRNAASSADTASGKAELLGLTLEYL